jgi:hypothetical protein
LTPDVEIELPDDIEATGSAELIDTQLVKAVEVLMGDAGK